MFVSEAKWILSQLQNLPPAQVHPVLNLGSQTLEERTGSTYNFQELLFKPLEKQGRVFHIDIKQGNGIDLSGDIGDKKFVSKLKELSISTVLCNNFFEHVENPHEIANAILEITRPGGYILISVPFLYPYHCDPIDTMFRPHPHELASLFPNTEILSEQIVEDNKTYWNKLKNDPRLARIIFIRSFLPFYKPRIWWNTVSYLPQMFRKFKVSCILLQKME